MAASEPVRRRQCGTTSNRNNHAPVPMHHCPIPLSMSPAHFRLEVHRARDCPGSCEGIAHGMAHRANNSAQTKHKQNKPATTATILRNLPTTHSRAAPSTKTDRKSVV